MKTDIVQKALVINNKGEVLLLKRSKTDRRRPDQWDLAGGLLDAGESFEEGIIREILEESGLSVSNPKLFFTKTDFETWTSQDDLQLSANVVRMYYLVHAKKAEITISNEHSDFKWVTPVIALKMLNYDRHIEVISYFLDNKLEL
jgi:8-oxo-dGTP diphosphatase